MASYDEFLATKEYTDLPTGMLVDSGLPECLYDFQSDIVKWALRRGRAAIFADTGLGKTLMQLAWASQVEGRVLICAPLAVSTQTVEIASSMGIDAVYLRIDDKASKIVVTNYEMLKNFDSCNFAGVVIDESSILKSLDGATKTLLIQWSSNLAWRLACTATPSPNDFMELGNHSEFLGVMRYHEMLATFFINDGGDTSQWRLKKHGKDKFWKWIASWAVFLNSPSDLGYDGQVFELPPLNTEIHSISLGEEFAHSQGRLFVAQVQGLDERRQVRRDTIPLRAAKVDELVYSQKKKKWLVWCHYNAEQDALEELFGDDCVSIRGADSIDDKIEKERQWRLGGVPVLVTKSSIFGAGLNWQHCADMIFFGISDSMEQYYQSIRRCWRYGQLSPVNVHVVISEAEHVVIDNIARKESDMRSMRDEVVKYTSKYIKDNLSGRAKREVMAYKQSTESGANWTMHLGDCIDVVSQIEPESIDYSIFSPPFAELYVYSNSERDMGNSRNREEFARHFRYLVPELLRVTKTGRLLSFHCMQLPIAKYKDGFIGLYDFRGELIRAFVEQGWIYHSEVCIWKDPVTAMHRTKALGLLHRQIKKDSSMSRQGIADYLVTMRKPGENKEPITHTDAQFPVSIWQKYASPIWSDINPSRTLQFRSAKDNQDEKHICPLQLDVIERAIEMWTNPGDLVLSPFAGIGSEGYVAIQKGRKFVGVELKHSYFNAACKNLRAVENQPQQLSLYPGGVA